jgi:hypothetical protein
MCRKRHANATDRHATRSLAAEFALLGQECRISEPNCEQTSFNGGNRGREGLLAG